MTTAPNDLESKAPDGSAPAAKKGIVFGVILVLVAVGVLVALNFNTWILWPSWVNGADKPEYRDLIGAQQDPAIIPLVVAGFRDPEKADKTRVILGNLLLDKKNRANEVEAAMKDPSFEVRRVALMVVSGRDYFRKQYVEDPAFGVEKTLLEWLKNPGAKARNLAIELVPRVWSAPAAPKEAQEALFAIVQSRDGAVTDTAADLRGNAALKLLSYRDCGMAAAILAAAKVEPHPVARLREIQAVVQMYDATEKTCAAELTEDAVRGLVEAGFKHEGTSGNDAALRIGSTQILEYHPAWATKNAEALRAILALPAAAAKDTERRHALDALIAAKDKATLDAIPRYFHDPYAGVRSSVVQAVVYGKGGLEAKHFESALIGYIRSEPPAAAVNQSYSMRFALQKLRMFATEWIGFPAQAKNLGPALTPQVDAVLAAIFQDKEIAGVTRASVTDAWWEWLATRNALDTPEALAAGKKARDAFWAKAKAGDVAGAKAVLQSAPAKDTPLWGYEWGWVASKE